ncbi:MAG: deoxyribonuclease IV [Planctomycetes bacterium]|nr:deoxyribonuclease IV [Planctomycetota bacterium]
MLLGAHLSTEGGLSNCFGEAEKLGCTTFQIFARNQLRWSAKKLEQPDISKFSSQSRNYKVLFSHASYLINLASNNKKNNHLSKVALTDELQRAEVLGLSFVVVHPGSALDQSKKDAIQIFIKSANEVISQSNTTKPLMLIETGAGQGNGIGTKFEELKEMLYGIHDKKRVGICFDTCHVFASGYDIRTKSGWEDTISEFNNTIGLQTLRAFHLNDSKKELGSNIDRHEHIGKGCIGTTPFKSLMSDKQFSEIPKVIETPKTDNMDEINLLLLRSFSKS